MIRNKILIVEDDRDLRESWEMFFENFGFSINTADNGLQASEIINEYPMDIIVTDLNMPVKDGHFVIDFAKSKNKDVIVWVCSGQLPPYDGISTKYKIDKVLTKPFDMLSAVQEIVSICSANNAHEG